MGLNQPYRSTSQLAEEFLRAGNKTAPTEIDVTKTGLDDPKKKEGRSISEMDAEELRQFIRMRNNEKFWGTLEKSVAKTNLHVPGAKDDQGKSLTGLMVSGFSNALASVAEVTTHGANKYTPNGWVTVPDAQNRYLDALFRHLLSHTSGQRNDPESNLTHLAHAAWNILAILELKERATLTQAPQHSH